MSNDIIIKKIEYDFEIEISENQNILFNTFKKITNDKIGDILIRSLNRNNFNPSKEDILVERIEIDLNVIYIQELINLEGLIESHLANEFFKIINNKYKLPTKRHFGDFLYYYKQNNFLPWWLKSKSNLDFFLKKENFIVQDREKVIRLLISDLIFFKKVFGLFDDTNRDSFLRNILDSNYNVFKKIFNFHLDLNKLLFNNISTKTLDQYSMFNSLRSTFDQKNNIKFDNLSVKELNQHSMFSALKSTFDLKGNNLFDNIISNKFLNNYTDQDYIFDNYEKYIEILNTHSVKFSSPKPNKKYQIKKSINKDQKHSIYSFLKNNFHINNFDLEILLFDNLSEVYFKGFKDKTDFISKLFESKDLFIDVIFSIDRFTLKAAIAEISLDPKYIESSSSIFQELDSNFKKIENEFSKLHSQYKITNNSEDFIKLLLRFKFLNLMSINPTENINVNDFYFDIIHDFAISGDLDKQKIISFIKRDQRIKNEFDDIFSSIINTYHYTKIPKSSRAILFYKDIYFNFLTTNENLSWSKVSNISHDDILKFFLNLIKKNDLNFLSLIFKNEVFISTKLKNLIQLNPNLFLKILNFLSQDFFVFEENGFYSYFVQLKKSESILHQTFTEMLWRLKSPINLNFRLLNILSNQSDKEILFFIEKLVLNKDLDSLISLFNEYDLFSKSIIKLTKNNLKLFFEAIEIISENLIDLSLIIKNYTYGNSKNLSVIINHILKFKLWSLKSNLKFEEIIHRAKNQPGSLKTNELKILKQIETSVRTKLVSKSFNISNKYSNKIEFLIFKEDLINDTKFIIESIENNFHDYIFLLTKPKTLIDFQNKKKYDPVIKKISEKFQNDKELLKKYILFFNDNSINQSFFFSIFNLKNIIYILKLKFISVDIESIFSEIYTSIFRSSNVSKQDLILLISYILNLKLITHIEIIDMIAFDLIKKNLNTKKYLVNLSNYLNQLPSYEISKLRSSSDYKNLIKTKFKSSNEISKQLILIQDLKKVDHNIKNEAKAIVDNYIDELDNQLLLGKFNTFTYYIEFGSFPYESEFYNSSQLISFFNQTLKENIFLAKKHLFNWSKSLAKLDRFISIFQTHYINDKKILKKQFENILNVIYPDLTKYYKIFVETVFKFNLLNTNSILHDNQNLYETSNYESEVYISNFKILLVGWASYNLIIKDIADFFVSTYFGELNIADEIYETNKIINNLPGVKINKRQKFFVANIFESLNSKILTQKQTQDNQKAIIEQLSEIEDGVNIYNAGLLLFWPFLKTLFTKLNLLNLTKNEFKDELSKDKAIMLTDYIVNGVDSNEKDFTFNKVLCGIDLTRSIDDSVKLIDFEIDICDGAINALLSNWKKVKSIQTLRDWFINREARLIENEDSFILDVQSKPFDIFLKSIPWGISMINYDLMQKKLIVNWKY